MLFSSMTFLFVFLPVVCTLYLVLRNDLKNYVLLIASFLFYAWGEPEYLAVMLLTILVNYAGACAIDGVEKISYKKVFLFLTTAVDLSLLGYFKYFNFIVENINAFSSLEIDIAKIALPIGISFYTFQALSYVIDVYRGEVRAQRDIYKLSLYISLFPQLIAGPIVKYHDIEEQISNRTVTFDKVAYGVKRFIIGLAKKMLLANTLGAVADKVFEQSVSQFDCATAWLGIVAYSLQLFYDFSGYSDMAIGLGAIFGFKFLENFNYPYISKSVSEFWRRWHISLSTWFKEYLYIPLGGNRVSKKRNLFNLMIVFLATGFWHGASWNFILWGFWNGLFIIFEKLTGWGKTTADRKISALQHIYCLLVFLIGLVIFRSETMTYAAQYLTNMFGFMSGQHIVYEWEYYVDNLEKIAFGVAFVCATPLFQNILTAKYTNAFRQAVVNLWLFGLFILSSACIAASSYNPFIYFRF